MNKNIKIAIGIGAVLLAGGGAYFFLKRKKKKSGLSNELSQVAEGISQTAGGSSSGSKPVSSSGYKPISGEMIKKLAKNLSVAMLGWGTNEQLIWDTLDPLNSDDRIKVKNYFDANYGKGEDLIAWFKDDLDGADLQKALAYYGKNNK
jgi:LPXTG-motif cell wall-anchored protein